jgi:uncharacterized C2H2 Zn-finger protein
LEDDISCSLESQAEGGVGCQLCGKVFTNNQNARRHVRNAHMSGPITCDYCNKVLKNERTYKLHVAANHAEKESFSSVRIKMLM